MLLNSDTNVYAITTQNWTVSVTLSPDSVGTVVRGNLTENDHAMISLVSLLKTKIFDSSCRLLASVWGLSTGKDMYSELYSSGSVKKLT